MDISEQRKEQRLDSNRRSGADRRLGARRFNAAAHPTGGVAVERRARERRCSLRRSDDLPSLWCPDCVEPLQYEAALSWRLPGTYTVDAGYCPSCARRFLRDRETGVYDGISW